MVIRLNLGAGPVKEKGYINIDLNVEADIKMDALHLTYKDNSIDEVYNSHLLEHFGKREVPVALKEWYRVLKVGGLLKMDIPNLAWCMSSWLLKNEEEKFGFPLDAIFGHQKNDGEYHKTGFTKNRLIQLLTETGFKEIKIVDHWSHDQQCFLVEGKK